MLPPRTTTERIFRLPGAGSSGHLRAGYIYRGIGVQKNHEMTTGDYALVYVLTGNGIYNISGKSYPLAPGSLFQRLPGIHHQTIFSDDDIVVTQYIAVPAEVYQLMARLKAVSPEKPVRKVGLKESVTHRWFRLTDQLKTCNERQLTKCTAKMIQFITDLMEMADIEECTSYSVSKLMEMACHRLGQDLGERLNIPDMAEEFGMTHSTFRRHFKAWTNTTPNNYRIQRRIHEAQCRLASETVPVTRIADDLGYADVYTFSKQFKKIVGLPPGKFRRQNH